ncbi:unnamed protein product [Cladocopium goreaui]|uniref:Protein FRA10AC1 n=1 Tax=Cladocopium goreaui TaxID=2562237 RepID=A0A9P1GGQ5_9DINO|nr:unnamed protein product [Cladocopium goreaui]
MQLSTALAKARLSLRLRWRPREENVEADDLTNERFSGFDLEKRIAISWQDLDLDILQSLVQTRDEFEQKKGLLNVKHLEAPMTKLEWREIAPPCEKNCFFDDYVVFCNEHHVSSTESLVELLLQVLEGSLLSRVGPFVHESSDQHAFPFTGKKLEGQTIDACEGFNFLGECRAEIFDTFFRQPSKRFLEVRLRGVLVDPFGRRLSFFSVEPMSANVTPWETRVPTPSNVADEPLGQVSVLRLQLRPIKAQLRVQLTIQMRATRVNRRPIRTHEKEVWRRGQQDILRVCHADTAFDDRGLGSQNLLQVQRLQRGNSNNKGIDTLPIGRPGGAQVIPAVTPLGWQKQAIITETLEKEKERQKKNFPTIFKKDEQPEEVWPSSGMPKPAATMPKAKTPVVVPARIPMCKSFPAKATPPWQEQRSTADPPALGAKIVPKPSSVAVTVPTRASTEDIDKWDDLEEESVEAGGSLSSLAAATVAVVEAETNVSALTHEAEPKLPSVAVSQAKRQSPQVPQPKVVEAETNVSALIQEAEPKLPSVAVSQAKRQSPQVPQPKAERETPAEAKRQSPQVPQPKVVEAETNVSALIQEAEPKLPSVAVSQAKRQSPQVPQPKAERETPAEVETKMPDVVVAEAETNVSALIQEAEPKPPSIAVNQAKRQGPRLPQPKAERETPAEVETKMPDVVVVEAETNVSALIQEAEPKLPSVAVNQGKRQSPRLPQPKVETKTPDVVASERQDKAKACGEARKPGFDWIRLAKIDSILLGCESNFFVNRQGDGSRIPGQEPEPCESSGSEDEEDDMDESEESEQESDAAADPAKILNAGPADDEFEEEEEEEEEDDEVEELDQDAAEEIQQEAASTFAVATTRPKAKAAPPELVQQMSAAKATRPKPAPAVPPPLHSRPAREGKAQAADPTEEEEGKGEEHAPEEDEDFNDEEMRAAFAAKLQEPGQEGTGEGSATEQDGCPANIATRAKAKPKPKAWGAPPPLSGKKKDADRGADAEMDDSTKPEEIPENDQPPPPFFDQWLASLKFIAGWNDQKKYEADQVKEAFSQYLAAEDIVSKDTVEQLCRTIVPLLLDLERVDSMVVANLRKEVLRTLKIVQVCILRIVTFELLREHSAKAAKKGRGKKQAEIPPEGATYLASDITSLAKVIQHFRFDQTFTKGVHQLIVSFRRQKPEKPEKLKPKGPASRKRQGQGAAESDDQMETGDDPSRRSGGEEVPPEAEADADAEAAQATEADGEEQPMQDETDEVDDRPKKKPRIVS